MHYRIGDSRGPNGHTPYTGSKQEDQNSRTLSTDFLFRLVRVHHQISAHLILRNFHLQICHGLFLSIGRAPDFDSLGPYQNFVLDLLGAGMP